MQPNLSTAANSGIPVGLRRRAADDAALKDAKGHAAGVLFVAPDGDVLMLRRSSTAPNYGGHWSLPGGKVEDGETPEQGAAREAEEEMGGSMNGRALKSIDSRITPTGMAFHTFAHPVEKKFQPKLNDEHSGFSWSSLDQLPHPLHPGVEATLKDRLGTTDDMSPEDWSGLRDGLLKFLAEEEDEPEHEEAEIAATDSALTLALDRDPSVRRIDEDGHLHVAQSVISKAVVSPYKGSEIPGWQDLGLEENEIYHLLRGPDELAKAAPTFDGKPLLLRHRAIDAKDHQHDLVIGSVSNPVFEDPDLKAELVIWPKEAIDAIEDGSRREISCGYRYVPVMESGTWNGQPYSGKMTQISGNHIAIIPDGRVPGAVVGDDKTDLQWAIIENALSEFFLHA